MKNGTKASSMAVFFSWRRLGQWPGLLSFFLGFPPLGATDHVVQLPTPLPDPDSLSRHPISSPAAATPRIRPAVAANGECHRQPASVARLSQIGTVSTGTLEIANQFEVRTACVLRVSEHIVCSVCEEVGHLFNWILDCCLDVCRIYFMSNLFNLRLLFFTCKQLMRKSDNRLPIIGHSLSVYFSKEVWHSCFFHQTLFYYKDASFLVHLQSLLSTKTSLGYYRAFAVLFFSSLI